MGVFTWEIITESVFSPCEINMKCEIIRKVFYKDSLLCAQKTFYKYFLFRAFPQPSSTSTG